MKPALQYYREFNVFSPAVAEFEVQPHPEEGLVLLDGVCNGDLDLVSEELSLLVRGLDVFQSLLDIRRLKHRTKT